MLTTNRTSPSAGSASAMEPAEAAPCPGEESGGPTRMEDLVGYQLRRASVFDLQGATASLEAHGLRPVQLSVLLAIVEEAGISSAAICRLLGIQRANIVAMLAELENRGLTHREADGSDNRIRRLFATRKGEAVAGEAVAALAEHEERLLADLEAGERLELRRLLRKVWKSDRGIDAKGANGLRKG